MCDFAVGALSGEVEVRLPDINDLTRPIVFATMAGEALGELAAYAQPRASLSLGGSAHLFALKKLADPARNGGMRGFGLVP